MPRDSYVSITTNFDELAMDLAGLVRDLPGNGIRASVWNDLEYAIYTEFGTVNMEPHAMVRNSIPVIEAYFDQQWELLDEVTGQAVEDLFNRVIEFALEEIRKRTHVDTGALQAHWQTDPAEYF